MVQHRKNYGRCNIMKKHLKEITIAVIVGIIIVICIVVLVFNKSSVKTVEVMDLYGEIAPYGEMSYGDRLVADEIFEPLVDITDEFEIDCRLAKDYTIEDNVITVDIKNRSFKIDGETVDFNASYMNDYMTTLLALNDSELIQNPGLANIQSYEVDGNKLKVIFKTVEPDNILALTENVGYLKDGRWYGTKNKVVYRDGQVIVGDNNKTIYVTSSTEPGLESDKRITNMILGNVLTDDTMETTREPNGAYGFLTWGPAGVQKFSKESREVIFEALENVGIRNHITLKANSIYDGTDLYIEGEKNSNATAEALEEMGVTVNKSLTIGVVDMGSFNEVETAITESFRSINIPVIIDEVSLTDLVSNMEYDLIYVRLERGKSPDFTGLFSSTGVLGRLDYTGDYQTELDTVSNATSWDEMCDALADLDIKLRNDGVWKFLDQGYDLVATKANSNS